MIEKITIKKPAKIKNKKPGKNKPDFESLFDPDNFENPLDDLEYPEDFGEMAEVEISAALQRILDEKKALREKYRVNVDAEYFLVVCFQCRDQKEEFLDKAGWEHVGDKYLDGLEVADEMGIELKVYELDMTKGFVPPKPLQDHPKIE